MNKFRKIITALTLSAVLLFTGCGVRSAESSPQDIDSSPQDIDNSRQDNDSSRQSTESKSQTEPPADQSDISETPRSVGNDQGAAPLSINVSGRDFTASNAMFYNADDGGKMILVTGECDGVYLFIMIVSTKEITANSSFSQEDFGIPGTDMYISVTIMAPESNEIYGGVTPPLPD